MGSAGDGAAFIIKARAVNISGVVTIHSLSAESSSDQAWSAIIAPSGTNTEIQVIGAVGNNITWKVTTFAQLA